MEIWYLVHSVEICIFFPHDFLLKFRQINFFTKELYCKSIWRKIFAVGENFRNYHTVFSAIQVLRGIKLESQELPFWQFWRLWKSQTGFIILISPIFFSNISGSEVVNFNGTGGESIYGGSLKDEEFFLSHDRPCLLSMHSYGRNMQK